LVPQPPLEAFDLELLERLRRLLERDFVLERLDLDLVLIL
jgi:hypothetical protein